MHGLFEEAYRGIPAWEIGAPQPEFVALEKETHFGKRVLDVGCGTGELSLYLAGLGYHVLGVDLVPAAIEGARQKAIVQNSSAEFIVGNALELHSLKRTFDTVVDCGLFHTFPPRLRASYRKNLESVLKRGGSYYMMVFGERETRPGGPLRITQEDIRETFSSPWHVVWIRDARFKTHSFASGAQAWLASLRWKERMT